MTGAPLPGGRAAQPSTGVPDRLRLLASGATQHVFVSDDAASPWVFKTPAFADELLPGDPVKAVTRRWRPWTRFIARQPVVNGLLRRRHRRLRARSFHRMGRVLTELTDAGLASCVADFRWIGSATVTLELPGGPVSYRGPLLQQRRADRFFETGRDLRGFDVATFIGIQRRLWQGGFGLADAACAFGPNGWAEVDGRLVLADTGSLTRDRARACAVLDDRFRESARRRHLRKADASVVAEYHQRIHLEVSAEELVRAWDTAR